MRKRMRNGAYRERRQRGQFDLNSSMGAQPLFSDEYIPSSLRFIYEIHLEAMHSFILL